MGGSAWSNQAVTLIVIDVVTGFSGIFLYSGPPAHGNLVASIANNFGTDPYGNAYDAGFTSYGGSGAALEIWQSAIAWTATGVAVTGAIQFGASAPGVLSLFAPALTGLGARGRVQILSGAGAGALGTVGADTISAYQPGVGHPNAFETWHNLAIPTGWTDHSSTGTSGFRYALLPFGLSAPMGILSVDMTSPAVAPGNGTVLATLPAGYVPATTQHVVLAGSKIPVTQDPHLDITNVGSVLTEAIQASTVYSGNLIFPLD